jgi:hypothetical protein
VKLRCNAPFFCHSEFATGAFGTKMPEPEINGIRGKTIDGAIAVFLLPGRPGPASVLSPVTSSFMATQLSDELSDNWTFAYTNVTGRDGLPSLNVGYLPAT